MPVKLCCPSRMATRSGYVNGKGLSPGLLSVMDTTWLGLVIPGTGFNNAEFIQLKIVVFAPIPSARVRMASAANPGVFAITRRLYRTSCQSDVMRAPQTRYQIGLKHVFAHPGRPAGWWQAQPLSKLGPFLGGRACPVMGRASVRLNIFSAVRTVNGSDPDTGMASGAGPAVGRE